MNHTHSETIVIENTVIHIDGIQDTCEHSWNGDTVFYTSSGKRITPYTYKQWTSYTAQMREPLIHKHQEEIGDPIISGGVTCSKCKKDWFDLKNFQ